jgi:hypothetical protein
MESKRLTILEKALNVIKETLEKTRRGTRNPSRRPITPQRARPARIARRGAVRHKKIIPANRGITNFWRSENSDNALVEYIDNGQWKIKVDENEPFANDPKIKKEEDQGTHSGLYHIHEGGSQLTTEPISMQQVNHRYGSAQRLESKGYRLVPHKIKKD